LKVAIILHGHTLHENMAEDSASIASHLSVTVATTVATAEAPMTPSLSSGTDDYFLWAVMVMGVIGAAANALVLYAMNASDQHKKRLLMLNKNLRDLCSCLFLIIICALNLCNLYLTGTLGCWLCVMLLSEDLLWCSVDVYVINLLSFTVERYLKRVHSALGKKLLRK